MDRKVYFSDYYRIISSQQYLLSHPENEKKAIVMEASAWARQSGNCSRDEQHQHS